MAIECNDAEIFHKIILGTGVGKDVVGATVIFALQSGIQ